MMGVKITFTFFLLASLLLSITAQDFFYNITIRTSPENRNKFTEHEGKLKVKLKGLTAQKKTGSQDFTLTSNAVKIKNGQTWSFPIRSDIDFNNIKEIELRWTLKSPFNPVYLVNKPKIWFEPIVVSVERVENGIKRSASKQYCGKKIPQALEHSEEKKFSICPFIL